MWTVIDQLRHDPTAAYNRPNARWIWTHNTHIDHDKHPKLDFFVNQVTLSQIDKWVEYTNVELRELRQYVTYRGELLKYLGIRLVSVLEKRRGGVNACFSTRNGTKSPGSTSVNVEDNETIFEGGDYEARFGMTKSRYLKLSECFRINLRKPDDLDAVCSYVALAQHLFFN